MDVGVDLPGVELQRQQPGASEQQPQRLPDLAVELVDVFEILFEVLPEGLFDIEGILSAAVAVHPFEPRAAVLAVGVFRHREAADTPQTVVLDAPQHGGPAPAETFAPRQFFVPSAAIRIPLRLLIRGAAARGAVRGVVWAHARPLARGAARNAIRTVVRTSVRVSVGPIVRPDAGPVVGNAVRSSGTLFGGV